MEKKIQEWKKKLKRKKKKIENILKGQKLKEKKLVVNVFGVTLSCAIYGATVENTLFEDGDGANTVHAFNPTQVFLHLKKNLLLTRCRARANMLVIILLCNCYFLKYLFNKYIEIIFFFYFLTFVFYIITSK